MTMFARALLLLFLLATAACASAPPAIPVKLQADPQALAHAESMRTTLEELVDGWGNIGRYAALRSRIEELGLEKMTYSQGIDWFSVQRNLIVDIPGKSPEMVYVVAHYDKTDINPIRLLSVLVNGALDDLIPPVLSEGALDNGTGVAVAAELAASIARSDHYLSYRFLFPGAEETGLRGTRAHLARLSAEEAARIRLAVNIDTVGVGFAGNCISAGMTDMRLVERAMAAARRSGAELGITYHESRTASDYVPFSENGPWNDFLMGLRFNFLGGLLPQRSWFGEEFSAPVLNFSACGLTGSAGGLEVLSVSNLHGPSDTMEGVRMGRLYEQYLLTAEFLRDEDGEASTAIPDVR